MNKTKKCLFITEMVLSEHAKISIFNLISQQLLEKNLEFEIVSYNEKAAFFKKQSHRLIPKLYQTCFRRHGLKELCHFFSIIRKTQPDILLIGGYGHIENWLAWIWAILNNKSMVLWTGAGEATTEHPNVIYKFLKKIFVSQVHSFATYGVNAQEYLIDLGVKQENIFRGVNVSDIDFFKSQMRLHAKSPEYRKNRSQIDRPILAFVGRFENIKGLDLLMDQLKRFSIDEYYCYFLGDGTLSTVVQNLIAEKQISGKDFGRLNRKDLAKRLTEADVVVAPSRNDPFSRVVSESISCGCYTIASIHDDAAYDLIVPGINGELIDPLNSDEFRDVLDKLILTYKKLPNIDEISQSIEYSITDYAKQVSSSINSVS
ncbi:MAG: glycosyltransferase family 4 protein [Desulfobacter sp.]|nr:MAG: glycosyltransferase family 4 protein [Desulfobacter sp.]